MKSNYLSKSHLSILAIATVVVAMIATLFVGYSASAYRKVSMAGFTSYSQCNKARLAYKSSWTSTSTCKYSKDLVVDSKGNSKPWHFYITYRY